MTELKNQTGSKSGFSRRDFFRGSGALAAATALQQTADERERQGSQSRSRDD
jgi:hypothetical protein